MEHAQTIAMARRLLAEGRLADVERMVAPLVRPMPNDAGASEAGQVVLRSMRAQIALLQRGDAPAAYEQLAPFDASAVRTRLSDPAAQAEVALWLGWIHAWPVVPTLDAARAVHLLSAAERYFGEVVDLRGRCWAALGKALAYYALDEYPLMQQALADATPHLTTLADQAATQWHTLLSIPAALMQAQHADAGRAIDRLLRDGFDTPLLRGHALAYRAALTLQLGRSAAAALDDAQAAEACLGRQVDAAGAALLTAYEAHAEALIRQGHWGEVAALLDTANTALRTVPQADVSLQLWQARLDLWRGAVDRASETLQRAQERLHGLHHLNREATVALLRAEEASLNGDLTLAEERAAYAVALARSTGNRALQYRALLHQTGYVSSAGDHDRAQHLLAKTAAYSDLSDVLPLAALRFEVEAHLAEAQGLPAEAAGLFGQARAAYALVGDRLRTAAMDIQQASATRPTDQGPGRRVLDSAVATLTDLGADPLRSRAQALLDSWPDHAEDVPGQPEASIGAALARAAISPELIAESWLQALGPLLPNTWLAVYRLDPDRDWALVRQRGAAPQNLSFPDPSAAETTRAGVHWLRLRDRPGPVYVAAIACSAADDAALASGLDRMRPWIPVATLALDHALLRTHATAGPTPDAASVEARTAALGDLVCASHRMQAVAQRLLHLRTSHSPLLITGERGTGKSHLAHVVHTTSERQGGRFVVVDAQTVEPGSLDYQLFGHFTNDGLQAGALHRADGGTLLIDAIDYLPRRSQERLSRFLQDGDLVPPGGTEAVPLNVRLVATAQRPLDVLVREERFVETLFDLLHVVTLELPPLRERKVDIPHLAHHLLRRVQAPVAPPTVITSRAMAALIHHPWPRNVRQLRSELERAYAFVRSEPAPTIDLATLSLEVQASAAPSSGSTPDERLPATDRILQPGESLDDVLAATERVLIERALAAHNGQVSAAARVLDLTRQGLYKKMKRLNIDASRFQEAPSLEPA